MIVVYHLLHNICNESHASVSVVSTWLSAYEQDVES